MHFPTPIVKVKDSNLTIVIPTKNEEVSIGEIATSCLQFTDNVIVVDAHSTDKTVEIAKSLGAKVIYDNGRGKGEAIRCTIPEIKSEIVVFIDADCSHDPNDIPRLIQPIKDGLYDHVTGSRLIGGSSELHGGFDECFRLMGSSFITACINWRYKSRLSDSQNGFRAIRVSVLRSLDLREDITTIEQEMIIKTLRKGFKMGEVPAHEHSRKGGVSKIKISKVWFRYGWNLMRGML
jgi:glycosyltransferase involved in cell wall biosynthesis